VKPPKKAIVAGSTECSNPIGYKQVFRSDIL
jgi:hypothetical protein